ncbi:DNA primase [Pseudomonas phage VSW-3]|uniref:DNA primase/helicase n=1 Tax=Pseudomonas phage VSW-3 TaxID=1852562 RepID=A0A173GD57_9CAUD|nr:DNA primase [Pseudomonas phage VSW-3]ANH51078.1 DNA primase/helicase [Pseudomonas phage VSW-3]
MSSEMMHPDEWLKQAQALTVGTKDKVRHLCGDASLVVYHNVDSWSAWCWRCHARGWVPKEQPSMRERLERKAQQEKLDRELSYNVRPPYPAVTDLSAWTPAARVWLYKAGLTAQRIAQLGAYWHAGSQRVVLPVKDSDGKVVFWQARNAEYPKDGRPKYISSSVPRDRVHVLYGRIEVGTLVCLTEDILSAFKVGRSGAVGYAVMGTALGQHTLALLAQSDVSVALWFDPDGAGEAARRAITKQLRLVGIEPHAIVTDKDPKAYSFGEIRGILDGIRSHAAPDNEGAEEVLSTAEDGQPEVG